MLHACRPGGSPVDVRACLELGGLVPQSVLPRLQLLPPRRVPSHRRNPRVRVAQMESTMAIQAMQPRVKELQAKYVNDAETLQLETARLYRENNINPLAGCLPSELLAKRPGRGTGAERGRAAAIP